MQQFREVSMASVRLAGLLDDDDDHDDDDDEELHVHGCRLTNQGQTVTSVKHGSVLLYVHRNRKAH